jgi:large subunit ribosomal protein L14
MIQDQTILNVADNSGAKQVQCFKVLGGSRRRYAQLGDIIVVAVKKADPRKIVKKHDKARAVVVRQKKSYRRNDGSYIKFDDNAVVILEGKNKTPKGGRIFGPIPREIKEKGFNEIAGLAKEII